MYINVSFASIQLLYNIRIMRSFTQLRKRYTESRRLGTSIWKSIIFAFSKWDFPITFPILQEITVLDADSPTHHAIGWVINETVGVCVHQKITHHIQLHIFKNSFLTISANMVHCSAI